MTFLRETLNVVLYGLPLFLLIAL
jgi:hypothetical protein